MSSHVKYLIDQEGSTIQLDLSQLGDRHEQEARNALISAVILFHSHVDGSHKLKCVKLKNSDRWLEIVKPQERYFKFQVQSAAIQQPASLVFPSEWAERIVRHLEDVENPRVLRDRLKRELDEDAAHLLLYRPVTAEDIDIRCMGLSIGRWQPGASEIKPVNTRLLAEHGGRWDFRSWARAVVNERAKREGALYNLDEEHALESVILQHIFSGGWHPAEGLSDSAPIEPFFNGTMCAFQFPVLAPGGAAGRRRVNYVDVLGRCAQRPVMLELKVWKAARDESAQRNSRGQYVFHGLGQVLGYWAFIERVADQVQGYFRSQLEHLDWHRPALVMVVNSLDHRGNQDWQCIRFRRNVECVLSYVREDLDLRFLEFQQGPWDERRELVIQRYLAGSYEREP